MFQFIIDLNNFILKIDISTFHRNKFQVRLRNEKYLETRLITRWDQKIIWKMELDMMDKQATVNTCYHMNSLNDRWMMRLKAIEAEYYFIENEKSSSSMM